MLIRSATNLEEPLLIKQVSVVPLVEDVTSWRCLHLVELEVGAISDRAAVGV